MGGISAMLGQECLCRIRATMGFVEEFVSLNAAVGQCARQVSLRRGSARCSVASGGRAEGRVCLWSYCAAWL